MSHSTSINLHGEQLSPSGNVLTHDSDSLCSGSFIVFRFNPEVDVILPGYNADAVASARVCAEQLLALANELEAALKTPEEVVTR